MISGHFKKKDCVTDSQALTSNAEMKMEKQENSTTKATSEIT
jgi:hypothetical protein